MTRSQGKTWRDERLGLIMIAASLLVIAATVYLLYQYQSDTRQTRLREQALGIARVLAEIPYSQLVPNGTRQNLFKALYLGRDDNDFAYAAVRDRAGAPVTEVVAPGVIVPAQSTASTAWISERKVSLADARGVLEVQAALFEDGDRAGTLALGFFEPGFGISYEQLPFFATLALVIFLLTPVSYFAMRREIRPLRAATEKMGTFLAEGATAELHPSAELGDFMSRFNGFVERMQNRIAELEQDQSTMLASGKLLTYRKARVESVLESLPEALLVLDETGSISFANSRIAQLFGVEPAELHGTSDLSWCPDAAVCEFLSRCARQGVGGYVSEAVVFELESMPDKTYSVSAYPLFGPKDSKKTLGILVVFRDVSLEALARRSRGDFVAHVAHELKTPLNVLGLSSQMLLESGGANEAQRVECVNVIRDEVERLAGLVRNLLNITQIEMGSLQPAMSRARIGDLLTDVFAQIRDGEVGTNVSFELQLPPDITALSVDKDLLRVAITNLLTNAVKYNRPGGTVTLSAEESDNALHIRVSDQGIGIAPSDQALVFDKFYRSDDEQVRQRSGHGLGLSLTRDIVHLHGGDVRVVSEPGQGSEFEIVLWKDDIRKVS